MAIYDEFVYADGTKYGNASKLDFSVYPLKAVAISNDVIAQTVVVSKNSAQVATTDTVNVVMPKVVLNWTAPTGTIYGIRLVRNQDGFPEHEEDGEIIFEGYTSTLFSTVTFTDQLTGNPLIPGEYAYYAVWLLKADNSWGLGDSTWCLIPKNHDVLNPDNTIYKSSTRKFIELFPKVYTTARQSYLDEIDYPYTDPYTNEVHPGSDFYNFFSGFAYTLDEIYTYADLLVPDVTGAKTNPNLVDFQAQQLGLPQESTLSLQRKKALIRNSFEINKLRGTLSGLNAFTKSITGFSSTVRETPNLLLSIQDSSFYKGVGNWTIGTNGTLTANATTGSADLPYQSESYAVDKFYTGKVITSATNVAMTLGSANPRLVGVPVTGGSALQLSYYIQGSTNNTTPSITWYDMTGTFISTSTGTATATTSSWVKKTFAVTAPSTAWFAVISLSFAAAGTYYVDMFQLAKTTDYRYTSYYEGAGVVVNLEPSKVNYLQNPSIVNNSDTDWVWTGQSASAYNATTLPIAVRDGSNMLSLTTTNNTAFTLTSQTDMTTNPINPGHYYTFSIYAATTSGTETMNFKLEAYDESGGLVYDNLGTPATRTLSAQAITTTWTRYQIPVFVPDTTVSTYLKVTISGTGAGRQINFDAAQIEVGYGANDYFDGSYNIRGAYWLGTANNSVSVLYRNKSTKLDRLVAEIPRYLPLNTAYVITSGFNGTAVLENSGMSS